MLLGNQSGPAQSGDMGKKKRWEGKQKEITRWEE